MAKKATDEPIARRLYAEGKSVEEISKILGVSVTSLYAWKKETVSPDSGVDEWERARAQKKSIVQRLRDILEGEVEFLEKQPIGSTQKGALADGLSKLGALVMRWEAQEREAATQSASHRASLFLDFLRDLIEYGSTSNADELAAAIEEHFDDIVAFGRRKHGA